MNTSRIVSLPASQPGRSALLFHGSLATRSDECTLGSHDLPGHQSHVCFSYSPARLEVVRWLVPQPRQRWSFARARTESLQQCWGRRTAAPFIFHQSDGDADPARGDSLRGCFRPDQLLPDEEVFRIAAEQIVARRLTPIPDQPAPLFPVCFTRQFLDQSTNGGIV